jgi:ABC transporter substrate binding protein (PQQ-dependent alcohol dehydrogenase system)
VGISRRHLLATGGAAATVGVMRLANAQGLGLTDIRVGTVFPARSGTGSVLTSSNDFIGENARMGAISASRVFGGEAGNLDMGFKLLLASSPTPEAAIRAGERLVATEGLHALIGGVGEGQAEVLSAIAERAEIPFFNVGESQGLRSGVCSRFTFHIEASAAMYLDAMVERTAAQGYRRWFVVHEDNDQGRDLGQAAIRAIAKRGRGGEQVGSAASAVEQPLYGDEMDAIKESSADLVLLLLDDVDQIAFFGQMESYRVDAPAMPYPVALAQSRNYIASAQLRSPFTAPHHRIALWETTLRTNGAYAFNGLFMARWGEVTESAGWAAFHAVKIFFDAVLAVGSAKSGAIVDYLESPQAHFEVAKGPGVSFRPWDHQLRQPLCLVRINHDAQWSRTDPSVRVGVAKIAALLPDASVDRAHAVEILDRFGDGPNETTCQF